MSIKLTIADVRNIIEKYSKNSVEIINYTLSAVSDEKLGYLGVHEHLNVQIRKSGAITDLGFFVKSIPDRAIDFDNLVFREESSFYGLVVPQLQQDLNSENWAANCYLARHGLIVLEDLRSSGFHSTNRPLELQELQSALACLGRFHASIMILESRLGKPMNELYPDLFHEKVFRMDLEGSKKWLLTSIDVAEAVAINMGLNSSHLSTAYDLMTQQIKHQSNQRNVVCHSDLWFNNMMFNSTGDKCRIVDFQMAVYSLYVLDVLQMIHLNARADTRLRLEKELIAIYHKALDDNLRSHNYKIERISLEEIIGDVEEKRICGLVSAVHILPVALWSSDTAKEFANPERCLYYRHVSRKELVLRNMNLDKRYKEIIEEVVRELVEYMNELYEDRSIC